MDAIQFHPARNSLIDVQFVNPKWRASVLNPAITNLALKDHTKLVMQVPADLTDRTFYAFAGGIPLVNFQEDFKGAFMTGEIIASYSGKVVGVIPFHFQLGTGLTDTGTGFAANVTAYNLTQSSFAAMTTIFSQPPNFEGPNMAMVFHAWAGTFSKVGIVPVSMSFGDRMSGDGTQFLGFDGEDLNYWCYWYPPRFTNPNTTNTADRSYLNQIKLQGFIDTLVIKLNKVTSTIYKMDLFVVCVSKMPDLDKRTFYERY